MGKAKIRYGWGFILFKFIITPALTEPLYVKNCIYVTSVINCFFMFLLIM